MPYLTGASASELDSLRTRHRGRWRISFLDFADGPAYDATPLDERRPRLVAKTAAGLDEQITAVENGTWRPGR